MPVKLIKAKDIGLGDEILCWEGDGAMTASKVDILPGNRVHVEDTYQGRSRTLVSAEGMVRLMSCIDPHGHAHQYFDAAGNPLRKQRTPRKYYWHLTGFVDEGDSWYEGPDIQFQTQQQAYAELVDWILKHNLDGDNVVGVEPVWSQPDDGENFSLWAICVFTRGCALVLYKDREKNQ